MPLPQKFTKKEDIPAGFEELYEEKDGAWTLKAPDTSGVDSVKEALRKEREARDLADKETKRLQKVIDDEGKKKLQTDKGITDEQLKEMEGRLRADFEKEYAPHKVTAETLTKENRELKLDTKVKGAMPSAGVRPERFETLWRLIKDDFDLTADGTPMVKNHPGVKVEDYLKDAVKKSYGEFYVGSQAAGGGAAGGEGGGGGGGKIDLKDLMANPAAAAQAARAAGATE